MPKHFNDIEKDALALSERDRAMLVQHLLETLDKEADEDVEELWLNEAEKRYEEYKTGVIKAVSSDQAFAESRKRLE
jgi:putative addiction module component (TIGR02574 family)